MAEPELVAVTPEEVLLTFRRIEKCLQKIEEHLSDMNEQAKVQTDAILGLTDTNHEDLQALAFVIGQVLMRLSQAGGIENLIANIVRGFKPSPPG